MALLRLFGRHDTNMFTVSRKKWYPFSFTMDALYHPNFSSYTFESLYNRIEFC